MSGISSMKSVFPLGPSGGLHGLDSGVGSLSNITSICCPTKTSVGSPFVKQFGDPFVTKAGCGLGLIIIVLSID